MLLQIHLSVLSQVAIICFELLTFIVFVKSEDVLQSGFGGMSDNGNYGFGTA